MSISTTNIIKTQQIPVLIDVFSDIMIEPLHKNIIPMGDMNNGMGVGPATQMKNFTSGRDWFQGENEIGHSDLVSTELNAIVWEANKTYRVEFQYDLVSGSAAWGTLDVGFYRTVSADSPGGTQTASWGHCVYYFTPTAPSNNEGVFVYRFVSDGVASAVIYIHNLTIKEVLL